MKENYPMIDGIYEHYKGGRYQVITLSTHTETNEKMVVYKSLLFGSIYVRPLSVWNEKCGENKDIERFKLIVTDLVYDDFGKFCNEITGLHVLKDKIFNFFAPHLKINKK